MDKFDRIYALHRIFSARRYPVDIGTLCSDLECESATVKRLIRVLREQLGAPIFNVRGKGWCYDKSKNFELPGLWFNRKELEALLAMDHLLAHVGPGLLEEELAPLRERLRSLLSHLSPAVTSEVRRIRILDVGGRSTELPCFTLVATAVLERTRLSFCYEARSTCDSEQREVSPQRLVHYRGNWYLDGFCHLRSGLRTFSLDRMSDVEQICNPCEQVADECLDDCLGGAYGIFSGAADELARLRFSRERAEWVAAETWHPEQRGEWLQDGRYELHIPFHNPTELILDICRYGPDVEVLAPASLRKKVAERLNRAAEQYI